MSSIDLFMLYDAISIDYDRHIASLMRSARSTVIYFFFYVR